jgi:hypothetical protein
MFLWPTEKYIMQILQSIILHNDSILTGIDGKTLLPSIWVYGLHMNALMQTFFFYNWVTVQQRDENICCNHMFESTGFLY